MEAQLFAIFLTSSGTSTYSQYTFTGRVFFSALQLTPLNLLSGAIVHLLGFSSTFIKMLQQCQFESSKAVAWTFLGPIWIFWRKAELNEQAVSDLQLAGILVCRRQPTRARLLAKAECVQPCVCESMLCMRAITTPMFLCGCMFHLCVWLETGTWVLSVSSHGSL